MEVRPVSGMLRAKTMTDAGSEDGAGYGMNIEPDDITVSDTVTVIWEIG